MTRIPITREDQDGTVIDGTALVDENTESGRGGYCRRCQR